METLAKLILEIIVLQLIKCASLKIVKILRNH